MRIIIDNVGSGELWLRIMKAICGDTEGKSMVDLGCHKAPYTTQLGFAKRTYVDILDRRLDDKNEQQFFIEKDVFDFFAETDIYYDVSIASDYIEHLFKEQGYELLFNMELHSDKQVIFTPIGEYLVNVKDSHPDIHKSGWHPEDLKNWASIVLPKFHPELNIGAFFSFKCANLDAEFERVYNELKSII